MCVVAIDDDSYVVEQVLTGTVIRTLHEDKKSPTNLHQRSRIRLVGRA